MVGTRDTEMNNTRSQLPRSLEFSRGVRSVGKSLQRQVPVVGGTQRRKDLLYLGRLEEVNLELCFEGFRGELEEGKIEK